MNLVLAMYRFMIIFAEAQAVAYSGPAITSTDSS